MTGAPFVDRVLHLDFMGDWGQANFHRICSWLCQEVCERSAHGTRVAIWNTVGGGADAPISVSRGEIDLCLATPAALLASAVAGTGLFAMEPLPNLRALATLPQTDRMVFAIDPKFGVRTFADLRRTRPPIVIATAPDDGISLIGYVAARFLEAHGIDVATLESWGGSLVVDQRPEVALARMERGEADAVLQEAIMTPWWQTMMTARSAVALPAEDAALEIMERAHGMGRATLPPHYLPSQPEALSALDFSDFVVLVRSDMPGDVAHLLTWALVETRDAIERQYRHIPPDRSPLTYPLDPHRMANTPIPLHEGALRYYRSAGLIDEAAR